MSELTRRRFLEGAGALAAVGFLPRLSLAAAETPRRLILVILRGGLDGLAAVPPYGESGYGRTRGRLALGAPGTEGGVLKLDGTFGLHPGLKGLHDLYEEGSLAVVHALATPYRERSHFAGQDVLENGTEVPHAQSGWLNRALEALPERSADRSASLGMALAQSVPKVLRGPAPVDSWAPSRLPGLDPDTLDRLADLYSEAPFFATRLAQALATDEMAERAIGSAGAGRQRVRGRQGAGQIASLARAAARTRAPGRGGWRVGLRASTGAWICSSRAWARSGRRRSCSSCRNSVEPRARTERAVRITGRQVWGSSSAGPFAEGAS